VLDVCGMAEKARHNGQAYIRARRDGGSMGGRAAGAQHGGGMRNWNSSDQTAYMYTAAVRLVLGAWLGGDESGRVMRVV